MAKGPGVSATSHIIAQSQTNIHYYSDLPKRLQQIIFKNGGKTKRRAIAPQIRFEEE
jgi:hypothetical protein